MKILFVMLNPDYMRNYESTLRLLAKKDIQVYIGFNNIKSRKSEGLEKTLAEELSNITYLPGLLPRDKDAFAVLTRWIRDYLRYLSPEYQGAFQLRRRMAEKLWILRYPSIAVLTAYYFCTGQWGLRLANRLLKHVESGILPDENITEFIRSLNPDILLVSPLVDFDAVQNDYLKAARKLEIPAGLCVHSWDNLTNKGLIKVAPDKVFLWNDIQKMEAMELHGIEESKIVVTGAQCYDKWFRQKPSTNKGEFCRKIGLHEKRPYILYLCSSSFIAPDEVGFVRDWLKAIRKAPNTALREAGILIRPHFQNAKQWEGVDFTDFENVVVWPRTGENPVSDESRANFYDSLYHSSAVVGLNTSAMIEAGILGKPVLTVLDMRFKGTQEGTLHFHYLVKGGLLYIGKDLSEHLSQLINILEGKDTLYKEKIRRFINDFIRPRGLDVECTPVLADAIESLPKIKPSRLAPPSAGAVFLRIIFWPAAVLLQFLLNRNERKKIQMVKGTLKKEWKGFFEHADRNIFKQAMHSRRLIEIIINNVPKGAKVLETGCGSATLSLILADCGFNVTALDLDKDVLEYAKKRKVLNSNSLSFIQGDIFNLSAYLRDKEFDLVCHSGVMEHFSDEDIIKGLSEQRKVAVKLIFNVPNNHNRLTKKHFGNERFLSNSHWIRLIKKSGFNKVEVFGGYDIVTYMYFILPGVFFHRKASFWWKYLSRHSIFVCE